MSTVWVPVEDTAAWVKATVETDPKGAEVSVRRLDTNAVMVLPSAEFVKLPFADTSGGLPLDDLTQLPDVHDASMLDTLRSRYASDDIFTAIGPVIISINPYKPVHKCSADSIANLCKMGEAAPPHVARAATVAFNGITGRGGGDIRAQSILISGESGAGKTEACKLSLLALAELSQSSGSATEAALESALLLETFGNAKTVYNDNSSRFGKWCSVHFDQQFKIISCQAQVYLLEKTRVVSPNPGERNYHAFYQMLKGATPEERTAFGLLSKYTDYGYLSQGIENVQRVDDAADWGETKTKMALLGLGAEAKDSALKLIAAVLSLGNVSFAPQEGSEILVPADLPWVGQVAALLGVEATVLANKLTTRLVSSGRGSTYTKPLEESQCVDSRDALAQSLYVQVFCWIVEQLNEHQRPEGGLPTGSGADERFIGLLDIFGFENFAHNSFEQLCINFTNEKLQAHFMDALVKLRMLEYEKEGVPHSAIQFPDNEAQLELIDGKREGLFATLDDECNMPKGSERGYIDKLHGLFAPGKSKDSECYDKLKKAKGGLVGERTAKQFTSHGADLDSLSFVVCHYAEPVCYTADGWLDKNRGYLHADLALMLANSSSGLVKSLYPASAASETSKKVTVSASFRKSLRALSATMLQTAQWYVRCIKPNGQREADNFEGRFVLRQLRYTGVASVVEIQRSGYPVSISHRDFLSRYRCIALESPKLCTALKGTTPAEACRALLDAGPALAKLEGNPQWLAEHVAVIGKTRVFMKDGVVRALEEPRITATSKAGLVMQRFARRMLARFITRILLMHLPKAAAVRAAIKGLDAKLAAEKLDALTTAWSQTRLPLRKHPLVQECQDDMQELRGEVQALEEGLEAEDEALRDLQLALEKAGGGLAAKEAYVTIKVALNTAKDASKGLRVELTQAIAKAEAMLEKSLADMGLKGKGKGEAVDLEADVEAAAAKAAMEANDPAAKEAERQAREIAAMEAEVQRAQFLKEQERRQRQVEVERELVAAAAKPDAKVQILTVPLNNDYDASDSSAKRFVGYSEAGTGVVFSSETNAVSVLRRGGQAMRDGRLKMGDIVLAVDNTPLEGARVTEVLNLTKKETYELKVARDTSEGGGKGDHSGWLFSVRARDGKALVGQWVRKFWVTLDGVDVIFRDSQRGRVITERSVSLKGAECKTPVTQLKGQTLKQPPVISGLLDKQRFPFTLHWPNGEVDHMVVLAAATSADRTAWKKAIDRQFAELKKNAPVSGWLMKQSGRKGNTGFGLVKTFTSGWKRRWFVLTPGEEGTETTFRYFKDYQACTRNGPPLGFVVINDGSMLSVAGAESNKPNSMSVTSQGTNDPKPITTVLACQNRAELDKWMKSINRAIKSSGGTVAKESALYKAANQSHQRFEKISAAMANVMAMAALDTDELKGMKPKELFKVVEYLHVELPSELEWPAFKKVKDKDLIKINTVKVVQIIDSKRRADAAQASQHDLLNPSVMRGRARQKTTWDSQEGMAPVGE